MLPDANILYSECVKQQFMELVYKEHKERGWCMLPFWEEDGVRILGEERMKQVPKCANKSGDFTGSSNYLTPLMVHYASLKVAYFAFPCRDCYDLSVPTEPDHV